MKNKRSRAFGAFGITASFLALGVLVGCPAAKTSDPLSSGKVISSCKVGIISNNSAKLGGRVLGPSGIISNNSSKVVSNNSSKYRLQANTAVDNAIVYLTSPEEEFYTDADGKVLYAVTDAEGNYHFDQAPGGVPLIVTVVGANDRRLVGFRRTLDDKRQTEQKIDVSLASTYVTELLRAQSRDLGRTMLSFYNEARIFNLVALTEALIAKGGLVLDENDGLAIRNLPKLRNDYLASFAAENGELSQAWAELLKQKFLLVTTIKTGLSGGSGTSVAVDRTSGNIFLSSVTDSSVSILRLGNGDPFDFLAGQDNDGVPYVTRSSFYGSSAWWGLNYPVGLTFKNGKLYFCDLKNNFIASIDQPNAESYVKTPDFGTGAGEDPDFDPSTVTDFLAPFTYKGATTPWSNLTKVCSLNDYYKGEADFKATGLPRFALADFALADNDDVFLCDSDKNVILRYRNGTFTPFAGNGQRGFSGDGGPATAASLNGPYNVAIHDDALYFTDISNQRIRKIGLTSGVIETVVGNAAPNDREGDSLKGGFSGDGGPATAALLNYPHKFVFDAEGNMLIADTDNQRIRSVAHVDGTIKTIAGMDPADPHAVSADGLANWIALGEIQGLALDQDGNLLMADARSGALRKLWLSNLK